MGRKVVIWRTNRWGTGSENLGDDRPVAAGQAGAGRVAPGLAVGKVADADGEQAAGPQRPGDRGECLVDGGFIGQVAEHVAGRDHGIGRGQRVAGKDQGADVLGGRCVATRPVEYGRGGVGGDDAVAGGGQFPGEQATAAAQFEDDSLPRSHRLQQRHDPRGAGPDVEAEAAVVHKRQAAAVIRIFRQRHPMSVPRRCWLRLRRPRGQGRRRMALPR